jgi:hypothetical protein
MSVVIVPGDPVGPPVTDAEVIEQSWAEPERFETIFRRYFSQIHQYLAARPAEHRRPCGSLLASSTRIPVPGNEVGWQHGNASHRIIGVPLITGDGTKLVAPFFHLSVPPKVFGFTITEFSVQTGKPIRVLYQQRTPSEAGSTSVAWVNTSGTAMIAVRPPGQNSHGRQSVYGVQT